MASPVSYEWVNKKMSKLIILFIAIALVMVILIEVLETSFFNSSPSASNLLVTSIVLVTQNVTALMASFGYTGVFFLMLLDSISFPIPSEMILPFAGYLVFRGEFDFWTASCVATAACVGGSLIAYYIGMKGAYILTERRIIGHVLFSKSQLDTVANWFTRYGAIMVFVSRLIPIFRTLISFPAGAVRMPLKKFIVYTASGSLMWNSTLIYIGYFLGAQWSQIVKVLNYLVITVVIVSVIVFVLYLIWQRKRSTFKTAHTTSIYNYK